MDTFTTRSTQSEQGIKAHPALADDIGKFTIMYVMILSVGLVHKRRYVLKERNDKN